MNGFPAARSMGRATPERAFTIVELLVVISIISVLMAMLMPAVRSIRRQAKTVKCLNNVKHCATSIAGYLDDSRGMCPPWITFDACQPVHGNWWWTTVHYVLQEYAVGTRDRDFWLCPADDTYDCTPWNGHFDADYLRGYRMNCSYAYNNGGGKSYNRVPDEGLSIDQWRGRYLDEIRKPSKKISMACWSVWNFWWGEGYGKERDQWWHSDRPILKAPVAFLDYHAEVVDSIPGLAETAQYQW